MKLNRLPSALQRLPASGPQTLNRLSALWSASVAVPESVTGSASASANQRGYGVEVTAIKASSRIWSSQAATSARTASAFLGAFLT